MAIRFIDDPYSSRISALEAEVSSLKQRLALLEAGNAVTPVTITVTKSGNALSAAEKMRRYRARKKSASHT